MKKPLQNPDSKEKHGAHSLDKSLTIPSQFSTKSAMPPAQLEAWKHLETGGFRSIPETAMEVVLDNMQKHAETTRNLLVFDIV